MKVRQWICLAWWRLLQLSAECWTRETGEEEEEETETEEDKETCWERRLWWKDRQETDQSMLYSCNHLKKMHLELNFSLLSSSWALQTVQCDWLYPVFALSSATTITKKLFFKTWLTYSNCIGVARILEWEVLRCRRRRGGGAWEGVSPLPMGRRVWGGENLPHFLLKIPYFDAFWHVYFLNHTPMGGVFVLTPPNPLLGMPLSNCRNGPVKVCVSHCQLLFSTAVNQHVCCVSFFIVIKTAKKELKSLCSFFS